MVGEVTQVVTIDVYSASRVGSTKGLNEDSHYALVTPVCYMPLKAVLVVADGISGGCGDIASKAAVNSMRRTIAAKYSPLCLEQIPNAEMVLAEAMREADLVVREEAEKNVQLGLKGTTCVAALILDKEVVVASIGDSRAYLLRDNQIEQLTVDQKSGPDDAKLANWLGGTREAPSTHTFNPLPGDKLLLCSDGLYGRVDDGRITLLLTGGTNAASSVAALIDKVDTFGGEDDATAAVAFFEEHFSPEVNHKPAPIAEPGRSQILPKSRALVSSRIGWVALGFSILNFGLVVWILYLVFHK